MIQMKLDTKEWDKWINNQPHRDSAKRKSLIIMKNTLIENVGDKMAKHTTTGESERSLMGVIANDNIEIYALAYAEDYLETGTAPYTFTANQYDQLKKWARIKLGSDDLAFAIAKKIRQQGTRKFRNKGPKELSDVVDKFMSLTASKELGKLLDEYSK